MTFCVYPGCEVPPWAWMQVVDLWEKMYPTTQGTAWIADYATYARLKPRPTPRIVAEESATVAFVAFQEELLGA